MMTLTKPPLQEVIQAEGIELRHNKARCPLPGHDDKTPSFSVKGEKWRCFGCGAHGHGSIDFVMAVYGIDFREALKKMGLLKKLTPEEKKKYARERARRARERVARNRFYAWRDNLTAYLADKIYEFKQFKNAIGENRMQIYFPDDCHRFPVWQYHLEILMGREETGQLSLYREVLKTKRYEAAKNHPVFDWKVKPD